MLCFPQEDVSEDDADRRRRKKATSRVVRGSSSSHPPRGGSTSTASVRRTRANVRAGLVSPPAQEPASSRDSASTRHSSSSKTGGSLPYGQRPLEATATSARVEAPVSGEATPAPPSQVERVPPPSTDEVASRVSPSPADKVTTPELAVSGPGGKGSSVGPSVSPGLKSTPGKRKFLFGYVPSSLIDLGDGFLAGGNAFSFHSRSTRPSFLSSSSFAPTKRLRMEAVNAMTAAHRGECVSFERWSVVRVRRGA